MLTPAGSHSKTESKRRSLKPQSSAQPVGTTMVSRIWWEVQMAGSRDEACAPGRLLCLYYNGGQKTCLSTCQDFNQIHSSQQQQGPDQTPNHLLAQPCLESKCSIIQVHKCTNPLQPQPKVQKRRLETTSADRVLSLQILETAFTLSRKSANCQIPSFRYVSPWYHHETCTSSMQLHIFS